MSQAGVRLAASVFNAMQQAREQLLRMATSAVGDGLQRAAAPEGRQDILLARMFEIGNDALKELFIEAVDCTAAKPKSRKGAPRVAEGTG